MKKWAQKNHRLFCCQTFNSKLSHFDKNLNLKLNLNHKPKENRYDFDDLW
jgi:hypothetical protein